MPIVAISREIGTGASEIAQQVARALDAELVDRRIIDEIARRLQIPPEEAERLDERPETLLERLFSGIAAAGSGTGDAWVWTPPYPGDPAFDERRAERRITEEVIEQAARLDNVVIVGRGAAYLLKDDPRVLRVFLRAPVAARTTAVMQRLRLDAKAAADRVKESDVNWGSYVRDAYHVDWRDPANYDLIIDTSRLGADVARRVIVNAATRMRTA